MKISFDYDFTLSEPFMQKLAKKFIKNKDEVYITTSRHAVHDNTVVFEVAKRLGIPKDRIRFTNGDFKALFLENFDIHFDDDYVEIDVINDSTECIGIHYDH